MCASQKQRYGLWIAVWAVIMASIPTVFGQCNANFGLALDSLSSTVQFTNTTTGWNSSLPTQFKWYIDTSVLSNIENPSVTLKSGNYQVCFRLLNDSCRDSICKQVVVPPKYCFAKYEATVTDSNRTATFNNQSVGNNLQYLWSFADGTLSADSHPTKSYSANGWYFVCLNISNTDSTCSSRDCQYLRINKITPAPCVASFGFTYDTVNTRTVSFFDQTTTRPNLSWIWLFGDGQTSALQHPTHTYDTSGVYPVCLLVSGSDCADSVCNDILVVNIEPFCQAKFDVNLFADSANGAKRIATFTNKSVASKALSYQWTVAKKTISQEKNPIYYFDSNGLYEVCLKAVSNDCSDSVCSIVEIKNDSFTNLNELKKNECLVFPNPATAGIYLQYLQKPTSDLHVLITDMYGQKLEDTYMKTDRDGKAYLDLPKNFEGLVLVHIEADNYVWHKSVIKYKN
jgi:PKD repeat protein